MDRRKRAYKAGRGEALPGGTLAEAGFLDPRLVSGPVTPGECVVCGARDARLLMMLELRGGEAATLCGSHALMHARTGSKSRTIAELREALGERRNHVRRAAGDGEGDELAERLTAAFTRERRRAERRAG